MISVEDASDLSGSFRDWLERHDDELDEFRSPVRSSFEDSIAQSLELQGILGSGGWLQLGWPESCGGRPGTMVDRACIYEQLAKAGLPIPVTLEIFEIIAPMLARFAPEIARRELPLAFAGSRSWCQGFSEPGAGSDLARLSTRAMADGDAFIVRGQKIWTSHAHVSQACGLLARTGAAEDGHKGLTMLWIDLSLPGVRIEPIRAATGHCEFCEVFFDDVRVGADCVIGEVGQGWELAMYLLQFERGMYAWMRQANLRRKLLSALTRVPDAGDCSQRVGEALARLEALRASSSMTVQRLSAGDDVGPAASIDKLLLGSCEKSVTDAMLQCVGERFFDDDVPLSSAWRFDWFWARASTVFGGAMEVQREIIADRLLKLPRGARR